ncbi:MAG: hypothetical protein U1E05_08025 [Patescibacteria group bacterium]|nr:hypothetical protein [Patescibacteria group bacterium]
MVLYGVLLGCLIPVADVGWRPLPTGDGMEYLIQLSPKDLEAIQRGEAWLTDIPTSVGEVRAYRITMGAEELDRIYPPPRLPLPTSNMPGEEAPPRALQPDPGVKPLPEKQAVHTASRPLEQDGEAEKPVVEHDGAAADSTEPSDETPPRPWMLLVATGFALAGSLGGNVYLAWALREAYRRCRQLSEVAGPSRLLA